MVDTNSAHEYVWIIGVYLVDESAEAVEGSRSNLLALHATENTREMGKIKFISKILTRVERNFSLPENVCGDEDCAKL